MNEHEVKMFLERVKGKKIRWNTWIEGRWFIPNGEHGRNVFCGKDNRYGEYAWCMQNGLSDDEVGGHWIIIEDKAETATCRVNLGCDHEWKITQGLFRVYRDCVKCGKKGEEV